MIQKLLYLLVFGAIGGLLAWAVMEPFTTDDPTRTVDWGHLTLFGLVAGGFIGALIGFASGLSLGTSAHALRGLLLGALVGLPGGLFGVYFGQIIFAAMQLALPIIGLIIGRIVGWGLFGMFVGMAEGVVGRSVKRIRQGAIGGAIGGALGGALFDVLAFTVGGAFGAALRAEGEEGAVSRAIALVLMGAGIGLFIGLLELVSRQAWVRVLYGRKEGKDYPIDRSGAIIGRDELADVPLRGDPQVAPRHAEILIAGGQYLLVPHAPLRVNGVPVSGQVELDDGDQLQIGSFQLVFQLREGSSVRVPTDVARAPLPPPPPVPAGSCPYCGQPYDPITGRCACSIPTGATPAPGGMSAPSSATAVVAGVATALVGVDPVVAGVRVVVPPAGLRVGREAGNDLIIPDPTVSRRHARIVQEGGMPVLYDEGSTNGTFVNEQRIARQPLKPGDLVRFGNVRFRVE
ncbi:MAG: FHA domain-containing protein [Armatimonadota bacterium]